MAAEIEAHQAAGISYGQLGQYAAEDSIDQLCLGGQRCLKRESLIEFIDSNTYRGWAY
ncbi:MAG: hypothetical protein L0G49_07900 [Luteococcus sp.]|uniref:hypothetical protein n=1 Tax=Luteococcus sp. TaxID=1969402 RepID=UPI0026470472|nr:hypothetical protein [Luteococcus sp.]MDN5563680.1 hypothetical protein [Luteococcus sp.]